MFFSFVVIIFYFRNIVNFAFPRDFDKILKTVNFLYENIMEFFVQTEQFRNYLQESHFHVQII